MPVDKGLRRVPLAPESEDVDQASTVEGSVHRRPSRASADPSRAGTVAVFAAPGGVEEGSRSMLKRLRERFRRDEGMTTAEYAAVAFAGILYKVVTSPAVMTALTGIVKDALAQR